MKCFLLEEAARDIDDIIDWMSRDSPAAARSLLGRLVVRLRQLEVPGLASMGRPGRAAGTRELVEYPFIIVYEIRGDEIWILAVFHGARSR